MKKQACNNRNGIESILMADRTETWDLLDFGANGCEHDSSGLQDMRNNAIIHNHTH